MAEEKDRFGDTMKLVERAKEDIYFAKRDHELLEKLHAQLQKVEKAEGEPHCPKCPGSLESYSYEGFLLDRCRECGGVWMDKGELESVIHKLSRGPLGVWVDKLTSKVPG
jgi:tRNA(Ile2) C34 agmatinyltransferase TiaS